MDIAFHEVLSKAFGENCLLANFSAHYKVKFTSEQTFEFVQDCAKLLSAVGMGAYPQYSNDNRPCLVMSKVLFEEKHTIKKLSVLYNLIEYPLHLAAMKGCVELFKKHLQAGSNVNKLNLFSETPLHIAVRSGYIEIVILLLEQGVDVNIKTINNETAIRIAISRQDLILLQKLLAVPGVEINSKDNEDNTYLHLAAQVSNEAILNLLIEAGIPIESHNQRGETPFISAVYANNLSAITGLLKKGANIDSQDHEGATALHIAALQRNYSILELLLVNGADVNIETNQNETLVESITKALNEKIVSVENSELPNCDGTSNNISLNGLHFFTKAGHLQKVYTPHKEESERYSKFGVRLDCLS